MSLINHNNQYNIYWDNLIYSTLTLSGGCYTKRHFELAKNSEGLMAAKHIAIGVIEFLPVIGLVVAVFERVIVSCMHVKLITGLNRQVTDLTSELQGKDEEIARLRREAVEHAAEKDGQIANLRQEAIDRAAEKDGQIARLRQEAADRAAEKDGQIANLRQAVVDRTAEKDGEIARLRQEAVDRATEKDGEIAVLRGKLTENERVRQELLRVHSVFEKKIQSHAQQMEQEIDTLRSDLQTANDNQEYLKTELAKFKELTTRTDLSLDNELPTREDLLASFVFLENKLAADKESLVTYQEESSGMATFGLHPILTEENWQDLLIANDLSYAVAKKHTSKDAKLIKVKSERKDARQKLRNTGWKDKKVIWGKTGKNNSADDPTCVVLRNPSKNLIYVAFHGSRNGSYISPEPGTDWEANYDSDLVSAKDEGLYGAPEGVLFHRGMGQNFISVQEKLKQTLSEMVRESGPNPHIILTGHSKGGGEAQIAVPAMREYLKDSGLVANVTAVTFSAPMTFNRRGVEWINSVVNFRNLLRVKVVGDPVTYGSFTGQDYAHVGMRLREKIEDVNRRTAAWHGDGQLGFVESYANYHYGAYCNGSLRFVPEVVMPHAELMAAIDEWKKSNDFNHSDPN